MSYSIDTDGTRRLGSSLRASGSELRDCATTFAYAAGLAGRGIAVDHVGLAQSLHEFGTTHLAVIEALAAASAALARDLTWAAQSAHEAEVAVAGALGAAGAQPPMDSRGAPV
ncbi:MAG TPA: hypothetical protein VJN29_05530 [Intrasporangium sp.]|uniref:hypothetical protein n=1 Tax=Intrasporangium sp. TaxID=1925024 RepID=UPI002B48B9D3|nr:hypothetical protein [Intrasporangium sp.]HKX66668.1 hypothetical protein [Intrasporangium sp.]